MLSVSTSPKTNFKIIHSTWTNIIHFGRITKAITTCGNRYKKIHAEHNQTFPSFRKKFNPCKYPLPHKPANKDIKWYMAKVQMSCRHGWRINNNRERHTDMIICLASSSSRPNWTPKLHTSREWMKYWLPSSIWSTHARNRWSMKQHASLCSIMSWPIS